jgi:ankyrin repeat protein
MQPSDSPSPLVLAAINGDLDSMRQLTSLGADVNEPDRYGWLPIHRAAANNRAQIIAYLLSHGSLIEERGTDQWTPLHLACVSRSFSAVATLVEAGANVNAVARSGNTPLHLALTGVLSPEHAELHRDSVQDTVAAIKLLLAAGADPYTRNARGRTPADIARFKGAPALAQLLDDSQGD